MEIEVLSENRIILTLPSKQRYLGLFLFIIGIFIPPFLYILNNFQVNLVTGSIIEFLVSLFICSIILIYIFILEIPSIYYFFSIRNRITGFGHIFLLFLVIIAFIGTFASIFAFSPILIIGIYFLTHIKSFTFNKESAELYQSERIFIIFISKTIIPFSEIKEFILKYKIGLNFLRKGEDKHNYRVTLSLIEKDPGFENLPLSDEKEKESLEFYRPQTLRRTLISQPFLIDSTFLNYKGENMAKINKLLEGLLKLTGLSKSEESINGNTIVRRYSF